MSEPKDPCSSKVKCTCLEDPYTCRWGGHDPDPNEGQATCTHPGYERATTTIEVEVCTECGERRPQEAMSIADRSKLIADRTASVLKSEGLSLHARRPKRSRTQIKKFVLETLNVEIRGIEAEALRAFFEGADSEDDAQRTDKATPSMRQALVEVLAYAELVGSETDEVHQAVVAKAEAALAAHALDYPLPVVTICPICKHQHIDEDEWATRPHRVHRCVDGPFGRGCGHEWYVAAVPTVGVYAQDLGIVPRGKLEGV